MSEGWWWVEHGLQTGSYQAGEPHEAKRQGMLLPALLMMISMAPACLVTSALHAATLAEEVTSQVTVLMPSSASCFRVSILHIHCFVHGTV